MKKLALNLLLFSTIIVNAQSTDNKKETSKFMSNLSLKLGFNVVDANKYKKGKYLDNVFMSQDDGARYGIPLKLDLEYRFHRVFAFEISGSSNKWKASKAVIDGRNIVDDQNYFSLDTNLKFYFDDAVNHLIGGDWLELYASGGVGYFKIGDFSNGGAFSVNLGTGITAWVSDHFGVNFNAVIKLSERDYSEYGYWEQTLPQRGYVRIGAYDPSHTQYSLGVAYRFDNNDKDNDGVYDLNDDCPNIPGPKKRNGCPDDGSLLKSDNEIAKVGKTILNPVVDEVGDILEEDNEVRKTKNVNIDSEDVLDAENNVPNVTDSFVRDELPSKNAESNLSETIDALAKQISFNPGDNILTQNTYPILESIADIMKENPNLKYKLIGHSDSAGEFKDNRVLSKERANAVKKQLVNRGVSGDNFVSLGLGEAEPIDSNLTKEGRTNNRRIEIKLVKDINSSALDMGSNLPETIITLSKKIKFNSGNYNFTQDAYPILKSIVLLMRKNLNIKYKLMGYTDNEESLNNNRVLSKERANAVRNYLVDSGIRLVNLQTFGLGESDPVDSNLTIGGRANNRRLEIIELR